MAANGKSGVPVPHPSATKTTSRSKPNSAKVRHFLPDPGSAHIGGVVLTNAGEAIPGATIFIKGTYVGTSTNQEGRFDLNCSFANGPLELVISFVGYETQTVVLDKPETQLSVSLVPSAIMLTETVVSASRVEENIMRAPVTIDKVSAQQIERISTPEVMAGLGQLAGVDVNSASMLFTSISTRGFNTAKSERVIQLVDYMDTALPSLNLSPGNMVGIPELDMESIEIVHGPASALYGSNALSGVVLFNSKDPFVYEGLSARVRGGQRSLMDGQLRYAKKIGNRFAFKINASYFKAYDWIAGDYSATTGSINPQGSTLGYDAINRYGELEKKFTSGELKDKTIDMRGYTERELVGKDSTTRSYRIQGAISYLINNDLKLTAEYKRGVGTATYQNFSRFRIKDLGTNQFRTELKSSKGFIRAYSTMDFTGSTYEFSSLAGQILRSPTVDDPSKTYQQLYFQTYNDAYTAARATNKSSDESLAIAHAAADATQPQVGSTTFNSIRNRIAADVNPKTGAGQYFSSYLHDISAQRNFLLGSPNTALIVGSAYRQYRLGSDGLLFDDQDGKRIVNYEYGGYAQITQSLFADHLKLAAAGRLDYFRNFNSAFSPRVAAVYSFGARKQHSFRASYGQAFRSPSQTDQYLHSDPGTFILLGNVGNGYQGYRFPKQNEFNFFTSKSADFEISIDKLRLERVNTIEGGYKGVLIPNLYVDASAFASSYHDFIGGYVFAGNVDGSRPTYYDYGIFLRTLQGANLPTKVRAIFVSQNNSQLVKTYGASFAMTYYLNKGLNLTGNYSLNVIDRSNLPEDFRAFFNTPKHKFNIGANGMVAHNLSYSVNYRWVEGHFQELPFNVGNLRAARTLDTYLGYTVPKLASTFQIGGSNILDDTNIQVIGGPQLGRLVYLGLQVNVK